jgi:hypothetical protein
MCKEKYLINIKGYSSTCDPSFYNCLFFLLNLTSAKKNPKETRKKGQYSISMGLLEEYHLSKVLHNQLKSKLGNIKGVIKRLH